MGTAAFAFEGIALVLPMYDATHPKLRKQFKGTMSWAMAGLCSFFTLFASVAYISFGPTTRTVVLNLGSDASFLSPSRFNLQMGGLKRPLASGCRVRQRGLASQILFCLALICGA